ncbi:transcriptional regulator [Sphingomonas sp. ABOLD]|uniref:Putative transcriptional regulator n=1 Tax=Sphingomonas trueperi TaxID=53317 RepID=A0A7X5Y601_9SPHN|nr:MULTISPECIES: MucR family transcriptional regulator [Sphingomonas]NJC00027.1 putative transcriptional regulator [Sphingomonas trueperi]RSV32955.1 transcriptional regulator [Sphingomonas sp. ABOLE]RSV37283.1 transcriptional regulator [Sphingomonas sp. ABOLD]
MKDEPGLTAVELATQLTIAWLGNQSDPVAAEQVPAFLRSVHATVIDLANGSPVEEPLEVPERRPEPSAHVPAVSVRKSLASRDHIISMIDGKPYRTLRRHLAAHGLTPDEYRARYGLRPDYPMVAETYSERRSALARELGLGQKGRAARSRGVKIPGRGKRCEAG